MVDLHTHSTASDGEKSPSELVFAAKENGVDVLALTDHDTVDGLEEAALEGGFDAIDHSYDGQLDELTALQEDLFGWNSFN